MWETIEANKRRSFFLFIGMGFCLITLGYLIGNAFAYKYSGLIGFGIAVFIWLILSLISYYKGSNILLSSVNATEVSPRVHPQLFNIVEEMKIAAGLPVMPRVYIINEEAPNAFATGRDPQNSCIAVTAGLLTLLNRDELQGVIAHEVSHIINRDILYLTFAGVMLGSITLISTLFLKGLFYAPSFTSRYNLKITRYGCLFRIVFLSIAILFAILGPILAKLFYYAISRRREYLADATAVRLTRYPSGLADALEKIAQSGLSFNKINKITAPMFLVSPVERKGIEFSNLSATHPPIEERIKILRSISQGVNFRYFQQAYDEIKKLKKMRSKKLIPESYLRETHTIPFREATMITFPVFDRKSKKRETNDIIMKANGYSFIECSCGLKIKVPEGFGFNKPKILCPKCGTVHNLSQKSSAQVIKCLSCNKEYYDTEDFCPFCGNATDITSELHLVQNNSFAGHREYAFNDVDYTGINEFSILRYALGMICILIGLADERLVGGLNSFFQIALIAAGVLALIFRKIFPE
jgi:heat shock protein HtpX